MAFKGLDHVVVRVKNLDTAIDGYRKIGFCGTQMPNDFRAKKRLEGFEEALKRAGLALVDREFYSGGSALLKGREMTAAMLAAAPYPALR